MIILTSSLHLPLLRTSTRPISIAYHSTHTRVQMSTSTKRPASPGPSSSPLSKKLKTVTEPPSLNNPLPSTIPEDIVPLLKLEQDTIGNDWFKALSTPSTKGGKGEFEKEYFWELKKFVVEEQRKGKVFPRPKDIYSWSRLCPLNKVRVIVIGQDPYHDDNQAHGLAFSVLKPTKTPPSLRNMFKELNLEYPLGGGVSSSSTAVSGVVATAKAVVVNGGGKEKSTGLKQTSLLAFTIPKPVAAPSKVEEVEPLEETGPGEASTSSKPSIEETGFKVPTHGDLTSWAEQGVLLLNTSLTVRAHQAASHKGKGWETFTKAVLNLVLSRLAPEGDKHAPGAKGVVVMAWGLPAAKVCEGINQKHHLLLKSAHPSPLSASRGFIGNGHFKKANDWLEERYGVGKGIDWRIDQD